MLIFWHNPLKLYTPESLLDAAIICDILSLGVDPVQVKGFAIHLHTVVRVLVWAFNSFQDIQ